MPFADEAQWNQLGFGVVSIDQTAYTAITDKPKISVIDSHLNTNDATGFDSNYGYATNGADWLRPTTIVPPRFARVNFTLYY